MDAVRGAIEAALAKLASEPLPLERIAAVKSNIRYSFLAALDTPGRVAETVGLFFQLTGEVASIEKTYAAFEDVTPESVRAAASRYFAAENRTIVTLAHERERG
jgi:zinc protease